MIGVTLVVAGDAFFITLFIVIVFHQMFEGLALGTRIASVGQTTQLGLAESGSITPSTSHDKSTDASGTSPNVSTVEAASAPEHAKPLSLLSKLLMVIAFSITTPIGMAIGVGVLKSFNGNDPSTLIALGTLDALSAGILIWVGLVEMWARDWVFRGEMTSSSAVVTISGVVSLMLGMLLMSFLGKWA